MAPSSDFFRPHLVTLSVKYHLTFAMLFEQSGDAFNNPHAPPWGLASHTFQTFLPKSILIPDFGEADD